MITADNTIPLDVVIVTYNNQRHIEACLTSLASQDGIFLRYQIRDNGSSDQTVAIASEFCRRLGLEASITVDTTNPGFAKAVNGALQQGDSEFVLILNPDTQASRDTSRRCVRDLIDLLKGDTEIGFLTCRLETAVGSLDEACARREPSLTRLAATLLANAVPRLTPVVQRATYRYSPESGISMDVEAVNGAFMLVRRQVVEDLGPMDEQFWMYGEDLDWCRRSRRAGLRNRYVGSAGLVWTHDKAGSDGGRRSAVSAAAMAKSSTLYFDKYHPGRFWIIHRLALRWVAQLEILHWSLGKPQPS